MPSLTVRATANDPAAGEDYYVYVYIDPRNNEEFYYGKGHGSRKEAHLVDRSDSPKTRRIAAIKRDGAHPIIRIIARNLSENEALLVEKTLLWKLGRMTTNVATGHFADKFRPPDTLHRLLSGFDFQNDIYYYCVGQGIHRAWDDYVTFGFISAGQGKARRKFMESFRVGDIFLAYVTGRGYVGAGRIRAEATRVAEMVVRAKPLLSLPLKAKRMDANCDDPDKSEYVCLVDWLKTLPISEAIRRESPRLFASQNIRASLAKQNATVEFVGSRLGLQLRELLV